MPRLRAVRQRRRPYENQDHRHPRAHLQTERQKHDAKEHGFGNTKKL